MRIGKFTPTVPSQARDALEITSRIVTVKTAFKTDAQTSASVGTAGTADVSGLSISHAAAASGNTILLICNLGIAGSSVEIGNIGLTLYAGTTPLQTGDLAGNRVLVNTAYLLPIAAGFAGSPLLAIATHAPGNTNSVNYNAKVINITSSTRTLYINRTPADDDLVDRPRTVSSLILLEIEP